ncbi:MAG: hypothetical protein FWG09_07370 [Synergistaceae bacterium]|nr:hypothetical protein [Synergistaceae bacterium]
MKKIFILALVAAFLASGAGILGGGVAAFAGAALDAEDFTVNDGGVNYITLDSPFGSFTVEGMEETDYSYVGNTFSGEFVYDHYCHEYKDFDLYASNMNYSFKSRGFDDYHITQITLKTPVFKTHRGIVVGSGAEDLMNAYGPGAEVIEGGDTEISYTFNDMKIEFTVGKNNIIQRISLFCLEMNE